MEKEKKDLQVWGYLLIILSLIDFSKIIRAFVRGDFDIEKYKDVPAQFAQIGIIVIIAVLVIMGLIKIFLGIKGVQQSKGTYKGNAHRIISKIVLVILILIFIAVLAVMIKSNTFDYVYLFSSFVDILIVCLYLRATKKCMNLN